MKAAVFKQLNAPLEIESRPDPVPGPGEVVVEVSRCGICGSDLHLTSEAIFGVPTDVVLGHEYAGRVAALGGPPDVVYECVGKPGLVQRCADWCRPRGTIVVLGLCTHTDTFEPFRLVSREQRIQASAFYEVRDFELAARAMDEDGALPRAMVTDVIGLAELPATFEALRQRSTQCKVPVDPFA